MKPRVLIFCDFYLPSAQSGGGMGSEYDFYIVGTNFDSHSNYRKFDSSRRAIESNGLRT